MDAIPGKVFVVGVTLLITVIAYSSQYFIFIPALKEAEFDTWKILIPLNVVVLLIYWNYYLAVTTDPGKVPSQWAPPASILSIGEKHIPELPGPRFCKTCQVYKPPRAHHCSYCRRCVLKMDHHCPWINNCVGAHNYAHFLRFVINVNIACFYVLGLLIWRVRYILDEIRHFRFNAEPTKTEVIFLTLNFVLDMIVLFCVGILSGYHLYCLARNQSTIESWERGKVETMIRRGKILPFDYPFSLGVYKNICSVLGNNPLLWFVPTRRLTSDGLTFEVAAGIDESAQYLWPPRDPDDLRPSIFSAKYRRQQERRQLNMAEEDSEDYYDSGSMSDNDSFGGRDGYSLTDEEENMQQIVTDSVSQLTGGFTSNQADQPYYPSQPYHHGPTLLQGQRRRFDPYHAYTPDDHVDDDDEDDTTPLVSLIPRASPAKENKAD
ncbi:zf-DHHC-domain-containing protein [Hesseltinella vesiculosa]|uniref:Palmitoyltransferase PFA4 n=1 Tax=Hesseltinella vesiculosa TaxID=101127 RepID=A0A1X2G881_9FUNG|nr:zf-DHHC-domain-containing protein [Hesseltinella vesiculosa]